MVVQPISSRRGIVQSQAGVNMVATALGNAACTGASLTTDSALHLGMVTGTGRSLSAIGTVNANGSDYAEFFKKSDPNMIVEKGDIVGLDKNGQVTQSFTEAEHFLIVSTAPSFVGSDSERAPFPDEISDVVLETIMSDTELTSEEKQNQVNEIYDKRSKFHEEENKKVTTLALCGRVPVNLTGAEIGSYIVPAPNEDGTIIAEFKTEDGITFEQYKKEIGKVISILEDGRPFVLVKNI